MSADAAVERARAVRAAFATGRSRDPAWRASQLAALARLMREREDAFADALHADLRKPALEAWSTETAYVAGDAEYARRRLGRWCAPRRVRTPLLGQPGRSWLQPEPLGAVLVIGAWNYPLQGLLAPAVSALAAGNTVLLKPSELAPATGAALAHWLPRYLDPDAVQVQEGGVAETTALLDQPWEHIVYTGGARVGRIVMTAAARHLTPVTLELGGKSPCVVLPDAPLDVTAQRIAWGKFMNAGQTCIAPDYVLCDADTEPRLVDALQRAVNRLYGPDPEASPDLARLVDTRHYDRLEPLLASGRIAFGGGRNRAARWIAPTVLVDVSPESPVMQEEIFGPILPVLRVPDLEAAIAFVRAREKPLAAYLFTRDRAAQRRFVAEVPAGMMNLNDVLMFTTVPELPHGGVGASGMGCFKGRAGFDRLSHLKPVMRRGLWPDPDLRYPPYTAAKTAMLRRLR